MSDWELEKLTLISRLEGNPSLSCLRACTDYPEFLHQRRDRDREGEAWWRLCWEKGLQHAHVGEQSSTSDCHSEVFLFDASEGQAAKEAIATQVRADSLESRVLPAANAHQGPFSLCREQRGKKAAQGQLVHREILVLLASQGHQERGRMGSR